MALSQMKRRCMGSLNPYYSGRGFLRVKVNVRTNSSGKVLILIILEEGSSAFSFEEHSLKVHVVLILIILEEGSSDPFQNGVKTQKGLS